MNNPFDRTILHELEKPLADDINQLQTNFDQALRFFIAALFSDESTGTPFDGFMSTGLLVAAQSLPDLSVTVNAGLGFQLQAGTEVAIDSVPGLNDLDTYKPIPLLANQGFTVPTAPVGPLTRVDIIEVIADRIVTDPSGRQVLDIGLGQFVPDTLNKTLAWALDGRAAQINAPSPSSAPLSYVVGQAGNPGLAPPTSPGYIKLAEIAVGSDVPVITAADITDFRQRITDSVRDISVPATSGIIGSGTPTLDTFGKLVLTGTDTWYAFVSGLEHGDIIENIFVVVTKNDTNSSQINCELNITEVDFDVPSTANTGIPIGFVQPDPQTVVDTFILDYASEQPASFPFTWKKGSSAALRLSMGSAFGAVGFVSGIIFRVRRAVIKRDS